MRKHFCLGSIIILCLTISGKAQHFSNWYTLYFTKPEIKSIQSDNPEYGFIETISKAQSSIYGAFYEISSPDVVKELIKAKKRDIDIRLVLDDTALNDKKSNSEHLRVKSLDLMQNSGIRIVFDNRKPLMHNKFAVIDKNIVWTGSWNLTSNCSKRNNNNAIRIKSDKLAAIYLAEFSEMFDDEIFGNNSDDGPFSILNNNEESKYHVNINGTDINAYFSPENKIESIIIKRLKKAGKSIFFLAFSFTSKDIAEAMIKKHHEGISVKGIFEKKGSRTAHSQYIRMKVEGLDVRLDKNRKTMHHKVIIIDESIVITGSYNFSRNADKRNDENILIIHNKDIAAKFISEYNKLK